MVKPISDKHVPKALRSSTYVGKKNLKKFEDFTEPSVKGIKRKKKFLDDSGITTFLGFKL